MGDLKLEASPPQEKGKRRRKALPDLVRRLFPLQGGREGLRWVIFWGSVLLLTWLLLPRQVWVPPKFAPGDIAPSDIRANRSLEAEDAEATAARQVEAAAAVLPVLDHKPRLEEAIISDFYRQFQEARQTLAQDRGPGHRREVLERFSSSLRLGLDADELFPLADDGFSPEVEEEVARGIREAMSGWVTDSVDVLRRRDIFRAVVRELGPEEEDETTGEGEAVVADFRSALSLEEAGDLAREMVTAALRQTKSRTVSRAAGAVASRLVAPNLSSNPGETAVRRKEAGNLVPPVLLSVKRGEIIVREGDPVRADQIQRIRALDQAQRREGGTLVFLGIFLLVGASLFTFYRILVHMESHLPDDINRQLVLAGLLVGQVAVTRASQFLSHALSQSYALPEPVLLLAAPYALASMLTAALFSTSVGILMAGASSFYSGLAGDWSLSVFIYSFVAGALVSFRVVHCQQRSALVRAGMMVGAVNICVAAVLALTEGRAGSTEVLYQLAAAFVGGIGVSLVASLALPVLETASDTATDMKLMELTNLNQPLLKEMIMRAPASYHHSVVVGTMAEAAAEEVDANPVLARVAAYYHDIGKIEKPDYFVENQEGRASRHEKITPNMSALILMSHVKDGIDLVRRARLPEAVVRVIGEHHGTRLITFFYNKAKEMEDPAVYAVDERDFRYPGPKPQSKEAALIMLADAVEAASKVLSDPTPARIRGLVQRIINEIFVDGQLDECDLTLKDLHFIAKSFTRTLTGIYHQRIDYPERPVGGEEKKDKDKGKDKDPDAEQAPAGQDAAEPPDAPGLANIRRLGQK